MLRILLRAVCAVGVFAGCSFAVTVTLDRTTVPLFEKVEASIAADRIYTQPYDPDSVAVDAFVTTPGGRIDTVPCFWYEPVAFTSAAWAEASRDSSAGSWRLRYSPRETGNHVLDIHIVDAVGTTLTAGGDFTAVSSAHKGFLSINPVDQQYLSYADGTRYVPIGENLCWNDGSLTGFYSAQLDSLSAHHANWARYWFTDFARQSLEWSDAHWSGWYRGLGYYSQEAAGLLDSVLAQSEEKGLSLQLVLQHHGQFSRTVDAEWNVDSAGTNRGNPYNYLAGGMLNAVEEFFYYPGAIAQTKKLYRYIIARWGYSPAVLGWELFNEVNLTEGVMTDVATWHNDMADYIHSIDAFDHPVLTSATTESVLQLLDADTALDMLQYHAYARMVPENLFGSGAAYRDSLSHPIWCGEFGTDGLDYASHPDTHGDHVRRAAWLGLINRVPNMFWYWGGYTASAGVLDVFDALHIFTDSPDWQSPSTGAVSARTFSCTVAGAPGSDTLIVVGGKGFVASTQKIFTIAPDGGIAGIENLSNYLQGNWGGGLYSSDVSFTGTFAKTGTVTANITTVSASGTKTLVISIDGVVAVTKALGPNTVVTVPVTAGTHTIRMENIGDDWMQVSSYVFTGLAVSAVSARALIDDPRVAVYVYDGRAEWSDAWPTVSGLSVQLPNLPAAARKVEFFNPSNGEAAGSPYTIPAISATTTIPLPDFAGDIALRISEGGVGLAGPRQQLPIPHMSIRGGRLDITLPASAEGRAALFSLDGRCVRSREISEGSASLSLPLSGLASGIYLVRVGGLRPVKMVLEGLGSP